VSASEHRPVRRHHRGAHGFRRRRCMGRSWTSRSFGLLGSTVRR
jgi:hypothetical protein